MSILWKKVAKELESTFLFLLNNYKNKWFLKNCMHILKINLCGNWLTY